MRELVRSNDLVFLSWLTAALRGVGIEPVVLDSHTAILEGSVAAIQRRVMVADTDYFQAKRCMDAAEFADIDVTEDRILGGRIVIHQPAEGYRAAIDPVLLAAAIPAGAGETVLDVGCGVGTAALCLAARVPEARICGIELQPVLVHLAADNIHDNGLDGRVAVLHGDLMDPPPDLAAGGFDHVMANPPFAEPGTGNVSPHAGKAVASVEGEADLIAWVKFCARMTKPKGTVTFIHRADRLDELLAAMAERLGDLTVFPLWPGESGKPAKRLMVRGRKGVSAPLRWGVTGGLRRLRG